MYAPETRMKIERELSQAQAARAIGNEGQARVCARRAAGAAIHYFFLQRRQPVHSPSAIDLLNQLHAAPDLADGVVEVVEHLLARVDENFQLPVAVDLIAETRWLVETLEKDRP